MRKNLEQTRIAKETIERTEKEFGEKIGLIGKVFGCWHKRLSRPFSNRNAAYRTCLDCGARRQFDAINLKTFGPYYYPPAITFIEK